MTMTTPSDRTRGATLLPVGMQMWRAVDHAGRALGNVRHDSTPDGDRWTALRFDAASRAFRAIGAFWSQADAVDSLRFGR